MVFHRFDKRIIKQYSFLFSLFLFFTAGCRNMDTIHPQRKDIVETVYASGKIIAENEYYVYALSSGTVLKKLAKEGDAVKKGQTLYIISYDAPAAKVEAARSNYSNAEANLSEQSRILNDLRLSMQNAETKFINDSLQYVRLKNLLDQDIGTKTNLDNAYTNYLISLNAKKSAAEKYHSTYNDLTVSLHNAKSQLVSAQSDLDNYFIRSEDNGSVYQTFKEAGEAVRPNDMIALLGESAQRIIKLSVDQQDINKIKTGQEVLLKTDITGNQIYHAVITRIYPVMNEADQTFRADAVFTDNLQQPYIHSSVEANIIIQKKNNVLIIPRNALLAADSVQVKQKGDIKKVFVQTGIVSLDEAEVLSGLDESSEVVLPSKK